MNDFYVVIDAGHGGEDSGAVSPSGVLEKDLTLKISKYMYDRFRELGINAKLTRDSDETLNSTERVRRILNAFGNSSNVIVISNHLNSSASPNTAEGAEVIYALRNEKTLAQNILTALKDAGQKVRRIYQRALPNDPNRDYYFIHRETVNTEPVIVEYGFINSAADLKRIEDNYKKYVDAVVNAVIETKSGMEDVHIVRPGDTLWKIAKMHGMTVEELKKLNSLTSNLLTVGQKLKIKETITLPQDEDTYIVKFGDTLYKIANMYNTTVDELKRLNNLSSDFLSVGQILKIREKSNGYTEYIVRPGDTLYKIARENNVTVDQIKNANNLTSNVIFIGQVLTIPQNREYKRAASYVYKVKAGDTLFEIANKNNITVEELMKVNDLVDDRIFVGQLLIIP